MSDVTKLRALSEIGIAGVCGYILGPVIGVSFTVIDLHVYEHLQIDQYTFPKIFQLVIIVIMIIVNYLKFQELPVDKRVNRMLDYDHYETPNKFGVMTCLFLCFVLFNGFTVQETITGPLVTDEKHVIII